MVKRNPPRNRRVPGIELFMECTEEPLSPSQITAQQVARYQYDQAIAKIRDAQAKARVGKATIINKVDTVGKVTPQVPQKTTPQKVQSPNQKDTERSSSPDIIFIGETPASKPRQPVQQQPQPRSLVVTSRSPNIVPVNGHQPQTSVSQQVYKLVSVSQANNTQWLMKPIANVAPQQQTAQRTGQGQYGQPIGGTFGMGYKRPLHVPNQQDQVAKKKPKKTNNENEPAVPKRPYESDESDSPDICVNGNWVPLDEYYYGKMEGEPTYEEEKGEFRFKCWYCNKMLYNNVKTMMHIQGHIDSSKQQNIDLSDLTQCKHCYKQFDTPFEMQTHVDKVHMSNTNVLLCRICDRDHESRIALTSHMRLHHNACEMPYTCQLCKFRSSMYSDVVDHFKKKHDSSQHLLCLYCLRAFVVKFVSQGWGTTQTYYGHLLKHQSKAQNKKCGLCRLAFFNAQEVKAHKQKHHGANQKAVLGTAAHSSKSDELLIKIPSSTQNKHCVKSLNAPAVSKVLDFGGTTFPGEVHYYNCFECKMSMGTHDHYRKYVECSMCRFATICSIAYANHMMGFHSGQMSSLNLNIPWERKMSKPMYCLCGFSSSYGNKIANHLVFCMKSSCYENRPEGGYQVQKEEEESDPRHKPGASLLDALGLIKRRTVTPMYGRSEDHSPPKEEKAPPKEEVKPKSSPWDPEPVPPELQGSRKWSTVKLKDPNTPTKESVFIGDGSKDKKPVAMETDEIKETVISEKGDNSDKQTDEMKGDNSVNQKKTDEMMDEDKLLEMDNENNSEEKKSDEKMDDLLEEELLKEKSDEQNVIDDDSVLREDDKDVQPVQKDDEKSTENTCQLDENDETDKTVEEDSEKVVKNETVAEDSELQEKSPLDGETVQEKESASQEHSESIEEDESSPQEQSESIEEDKSPSQEHSERKEEDELSPQENSKSIEEDESSSKKDMKSVDEEDSPLINDNETVEESSQKDDETTDSLSPIKAAENKETESQNQKDETESKEKDQPEDKESVLESEKQDDVKEGDVGAESKMEISEAQEIDKTEKNESESKIKQMEQDSHEKSQTENTDKNSEEQNVDKGNNSETTKQESVEPARVDNSKDSGHGDDAREYQGNKSHDQKPYDDHRSRSHDQRSYDDHRNRSHDHRSYDDRRSLNDRRSHDRNHYDDRSHHHYERQDDRNRYRRQDDRNNDRGYHDNRGYRDHRDNWDSHRDDRRQNRGQGSYQGHGGYGGGYHGYR